MIKNILIVGHGIAGKSLAADLRHNHQAVCGFLDDLSEDKEVLGKLSDVNRVVADHKVTDIYVAIPTVSAKVLRDFVNQITDDTVALSIIPRSFSSIAKDTVNIHDLTDVDIMALIGRQPVKHDLIECKKLVKDKTVLVTGAAGSIGSKLVKLLVELEPAQIVCVDWWENGTFYLQQDLAHKKNVVFEIADIKTAPRLQEIFAQYQPQLVFHAAAYKHVPLMQENPVEAVNNNVWGSLNLMQMAIKHKAQNFVYVSTDKAVNPANVMGSTKRLGEMLMETLAANGTATKFNAVRFGNVIQSNGNVMQVFKKQIDGNMALTVTHPDVTRFFMTVEEAAQLIVQSAAVGKNGEIFVLDMGEPIKIMELAKSLIKLCRKPLDIIITGLRSGDKMYEELSYDPSKVGRTANDKIFIVKDEKPFDHADFTKIMDRMLAKSLQYKITAHGMIAELKSFGFKIKD